MDTAKESSYWNSIWIAIIICSLFYLGHAPIGIAAIGFILIDIVEEVIKQLSGYANAMLFRYIRLGLLGVSLAISYYGGYIDSYHIVGMILLAYIAFLIYIIVGDYNGSNS